MRTNTFGAVFRIRHHLAFAIHQFFNDRGFFYLNTPIITASDCEGAGDMFQVTTLDLGNLPKNEDGTNDYSRDFFGKPTSLTVSGQLEGELGATALGAIYTFGPTFRAENSNTPRHLAEFWMIEPEVAFNDITDNMDLAEEFIKYCVRYALDHCRDDIEFLNKMYDGTLIERLEGVLKQPFVRLPYTEGIDILMKSGKKFEFPVEWGVDLQSEHERFLVEEHFKRPVILTDYPKDIKAFYMKQNDDGRTVRAMDVLFPQIGEIIGGAASTWDLSDWCCLSPACRTSATSSPSPALRATPSSNRASCPCQNSKGCPTAGHPLLFSPEACRHSLGLRAAAAIGLLVLAAAASVLAALGAVVLVTVATLHVLGLLLLELGELSLLLAGEQFLHLSIGGIALGLHLLHAGFHLLLAGALLLAVLVHLALGLPCLELLLVEVGDGTLLLGGEVQRLVQALHAHFNHLLG